MVKLKLNLGFTLIELVIVIVLIGILSAIALPKFMNIKGEAESSVVQSTAGAFVSAIQVAHAKWEINQEQISYLDINDDGLGDTKFSSKGWPNEISADGSSKLSAIGDMGVSGNDTCSQIMLNLLTLSGLSVIPGNEEGQCSNGDICAIAINNTDCQYTYRASGETMVFHSDTGQVEF